MQNKAVVVGALGVIGRYIAERLVELQLTMQDLVEDRVGVPQH